MGGKTDVVKGKIKEAAGALTGNDKLRVEGKTDQAVGKTKQVRPEGRRHGKEGREESDRVKGALWEGEPPRSEMCSHYNPEQPSTLLPQTNNPADNLLKGICHVSSNTVLL